MMRCTPALLQAAASPDGQLQVFLGVARGSGRNHRVHQKVRGGAAFQCVGERVRVVEVDLNRLHIRVL